MNKYKTMSKIVLIICMCAIIMTIINAFTGFINTAITTGGTVICIIVFCVAMLDIITLENNRIGKENKGKE